MKHHWMAAALALAIITTAMPAAETATTSPPPTVQPAALPDVEAAIPDPVKALGTPTMMNFPGGIRMAVSAATEKAQAHVLQGLDHLHGGWEFEASRHFAAAMREDPQCLLAHWGMVMSLLNPSPETFDARQAATERMLTLVEQNAGTELELGYAYGLIKYIQEGPTAAAAAFRKVAARFPNDMQAAVFAALFSRSGYDVTGEATPDQAAAEQTLLWLIEKHPESTIPLNALLVIRAEAPDLSGSLPLARKLCQMDPDYPPAFHLLGHYQWRCGHHGEAASSFGRASTFYQKWMRENKAGTADCPEWIKAECYRIVALLSKGETETALAAARQVAATPIPADRPASPGARFLLWEAKTLPARILLQQGRKGFSTAAAASLPKPDSLEKFRPHSLAYWWIDGLRFIIETHRLIDAGKLTEAREAAAALTLHGEEMTKTQSIATRGGERSQWLRSFRALEVLASDARGRLAIAGPKDKRGTAYNWFASATDRQRPEPSLCPPLVLSPMASRLGSFLLSENKPAEAADAYQRALASFPNDMDSLLGLRKAFLAAGKTAEADAIGKKIDSLKQE